MKGRGEGRGHRREKREAKSRRKEERKSSEEGCSTYVKGRRERTEKGEGFVMALIKDNLMEKKK